MTTTPTNNPIPSEAPQDLKFNAGKIDEFVNSMLERYSDRFGLSRYTIEGLRILVQNSAAAFGYITMDSFEDGAVVALPNEALRWKSNGEYYKWTGQFPSGGKIIQAGSTPNTTGGVGVGAWLSVGDASVRGDVPILAYKALVSTNAKKIAPGIIIESINGIFTSIIDVDGMIYYPPYNINAAFTLASVADTNWGAKTITDTAGVSYIFSRSPQVDRNSINFGAEYLQSFHSKCLTGSATTSPSRGKLKIILSGDSTTVGVGTTSTAFLLENQLKSIAGINGYSWIDVVNMGVSGGSTFQWNDLWVQNEINANPDLLILRWGVNDPATSTTTVSSFEQSLRSGLQKIRSQKSVGQLSILLMTPSTTDNDAGTRRTNEWHVAINDVVRRAARDFMCAFADTYKFMSDAKNSAGIWMDNAGDTSTRVHPLNIMYTKIAQLMTSIIFPLDYSLARSNGFVQIPSLANEQTGGFGVDNYSNGITYERLVSTAPQINGGIYTHKHCEGMAYQVAHNMPGVTPGAALSFRFGYKNPDVAASTGFGDWSGIKIPAVMQNGWTFPAGLLNAGYMKTVDGEVKLYGHAAPGTLTSGTTLFVLPAGYRPSSNVDCPALVLTTASTLGRISITTAGEVKYYGPTTGVYYVCLNGVSFPL